MNEKTLRQKSKFLSLVLRHRPQLIGIQLDEQGWVNVDELIAKSKTKGEFFTLEEIKSIIENNNKKRFAYNDDHTKIRANQGHSIKVDLGYQAKMPPEILFHGTAQKHIQSIKREGIRKRSRHHVHLSGNEETAYSVGSRHGTAIILKVNSKKMFDEGLSFYQSENGVWLTDYVDPKYISD